MLSVEEARQRIVSGLAPLPAQTVKLAQAHRRVLTEDIRARLDQPPAPVSAMDGYAVRAADTGPRRVIGSAPAGHPFAGNLGPGEAVRIFTGGVVPQGADAIVIQEDATAENAYVTFAEPPKPGLFIRPQGLDFAKGEVLAAAGRRLTPYDLSLLAAGDVASVAVRRRPVIAFAATGDELSRPGEARKPGGIVASSGFGLSALIDQWGGAPRDLGILPDTLEAVTGLAPLAGGADLIVTLGGASVGDHDLVKRATGLELDFWKIAMRPGKPLIFGRLGAVPFLGLPGNPVSTLVTALLFLRPAIAALLGTDTNPHLIDANLSTALKANDSREDYLRATTCWREGQLWAATAPIQDSSMLKLLAGSDALIVRAPGAPAAQAGGRVRILRLS